MVVLILHVSRHTNLYPATSTVSLPAATVLHPVGEAQGLGQTRPTDAIIPGQRPYQRLRSIPTNPVHEELGLAVGGNGPDNGAGLARRNPERAGGPSRGSVVCSPPLARPEAAARPDRRETAVRLFPPPRRKAVPVLRDSRPGPSQAIPFQERLRSLRSPPTRSSFRPRLPTSRTLPQHYGASLRRAGSALPLRSGLPPKLWAARCPGHPVQLPERYTTYPAGRAGFARDLSRSRCLFRALAGAARTRTPSRRRQAEGHSDPLGGQRRRNRV